jgi:UDP-N-acetylmuramyl pentapeptide phosphotransferase/UDP-N-acetylglucosamine-1-phosphate transferase
VVAAAVAAGAARGLLSVVSQFPADALTRINHRGEKVTLAEGPAAALAATVAAAALTGRGRVAAAAAVAGLGAATVGAYDDIVGARPEQRKDKGFKGHLQALREGRVSAGAVKVLGVGASGLTAGALLSEGPIDAALSGVVIAGAANVVNLLDLRPGRALKVVLAASAPLLASADSSATVAAAVGGAAVAALPDDLGERTMLGDAGANALGALLGVAAAARLGRGGKAVLAAGLVGLMAASEKVSFTAVIARTPALNAVDMWGRRPPAPPARASARGPGVPEAAGALPADGEPGPSAVAQ